MNKILSLAVSAMMLISLMGVAYASESGTTYATGNYAAIPTSDSNETVAYTPVGLDVEEAQEYTITIQSQTDENTVYSEIGAVDGNDDVSIYANFADIPVDSYMVLVYHLNAEAGNNSLCNSTEWTSDTTEETDNIRVNYNTLTDSIEVIQIDPPYEPHLMMSVTNNDTNEEVALTDMVLNEEGNAYTASINTLDYGTYTVTIFEMGDEIATTDWDIAGSLASSFDVDYDYEVGTLTIVGTGDSVGDPIAELDETSSEVAETEIDTETDVDTSIATSSAEQTKDSSTVIIVVIVIAVVVIAAVVYIVKGKKKSDSSTDNKSDDSKEDSIK